MPPQPEATMSSTQPFEFHISPDSEGDKIGCSCCTVYRGEAFVVSDRLRQPFGFCRICLRRMRATLKAAEKALRLPDPTRSRGSSVSRERLRE